MQRMADEAGYLQLKRTMYEAQAIAQLQQHEQQQETLRASRARDASSSSPTSSRAVLIFPTVEMDQCQRDIEAMLCPELRRQDLSNMQAARRNERCDAFNWADLAVCHAMLLLLSLGHGHVSCKKLAKPVAGEGLGSGFGNQRMRVDT